MAKVHMISVLGVDMWVAEDHVDEFKAAGHKLAADIKSDAEKPAEKSKRAPRKRTAIKK